MWTITSSKRRWNFSQASNTFLCQGVAPLDHFFSFAGGGNLIQLDVSFCVALSFEFEDVSPICPSQIKELDVAGTNASAEDIDFLVRWIPVKRALIGLTPCELSTEDGSAENILSRQHHVYFVFLFSHSAFFIPMLLCLPNAIFLVVVCSCDLFFSKFLFQVNTVNTLDLGDL